MGSSQSQPQAPPAPVIITPPQPPTVIHGVVPEKHHAHHHHEHKHHHHHHAHQSNIYVKHPNMLASGVKVNEHFLGLSGITCQSACNSVVSVGEEIFTLRNIILIIIIVLLAYYLNKQK
jgi:hypothetical protein